MKILQSQRCCVCKTELGDLLRQNLRVLITKADLAPCFATKTRISDTPTRKGLLNLARFRLRGDWDGVGLLDW